MKIRPVGAELLHAKGRTDMTNLIVAFRNSANTPKSDGKLHEIAYLCCVSSRSTNKPDFEVLLTVHLSIILVTDQLNAPIIVF